MIIALLPNSVRVVTLVALAIAMLVVPWGIGRLPRPRRTILLLIGIELLLIGRFGSIIDHWDQPLSWYGSPISVVAAVFLALYAIEAVYQERRRHG